MCSSKCPIELLAATTTFGNLRPLIESVKAAVPLYR
jgi:hypothetical protein